LLQLQGFSTDSTDAIIGKVLENEVQPGIESTETFPLLCSAAASPWFSGDQRMSITAFKTASPLANDWTTSCELPTFRFMHAWAAMMASETTVSIDLKKWSIIVNLKRHKPLLF
jgi:hypothetical protein